jgi:integrase
MENDKESEKKKNGKPKYTDFDTADPYYQIFYNSISSSFTRVVWTNYVNMYMAYHQMTKYSDLIGLLPETLENPNTPMNIKVIQSKLVKYINYKKERGVKAQTIGNQMTALRKFYWINEIDGIKWDRVRSFLGEAIRAVDDKAYTHEQIANLLKFADLRLKLVVLTQASTGMRIGGIVGLKWGDLEPINRYGIYAFRVYRKTPAEYITFCTPECASVINEYMKYRERMGEEIKPDSPFLREQFCEQDANNAKPATIDGVQALMMRGFVRAGMRPFRSGNENGKRYDNMLTHGFRKFAKKQMRRAGIDAINIEYLVGHKGGDLKMGISRLMMTYDPSEDTELLQDYMKAVNNLTIDEEFRLKMALDDEQKRREEEQKKNEFMRAELDEIKRMIKEGAVVAAKKEEENKKE